MSDIAARQGRIVPIVCRSVHRRLCSASVAVGRPADRGRWKLPLTSFAGNSMVPGIETCGGIGANLTRFALDGNRCLTPIADLGNGRAARRCYARGGRPRGPARDRRRGRRRTRCRPTAVRGWEVQRTARLQSTRASFARGARSGSRRRRGSPRASRRSSERPARLPRPRGRRGTRPCRRSRASAVRRSRDPGGRGDPARAHARPVGARTGTPRRDAHSRNAAPCAQPASSRPAARATRRTAPAPRRATSGETRAGRRSSDRSSPRNPR